MWVDSHCHLDYDYSPFSVEEVVEHARAAQVSTLVTIGVTLESSSKLHEISTKFSGKEGGVRVVHTVGVHPQDASSEGLVQWTQGLRALAAHPECRAIGEIGLDYYRVEDEAQRLGQRVSCEAQLALASELKLPVVIHSRDAEEDLLPLLKSYARGTSLGAAPIGVIHCFTGTAEFAHACLDLGFVVSISGIITFKNAQALRDTVRGLPLERLMVETDAPYLAPVPFRGKKAEPAMVVHTGVALAELFGRPLDEVARLTSANAARLFGL